LYSANEAVARRASLSWTLEGRAHAQREQRVGYFNSQRVE